MKDLEGQLYYDTTSAKSKIASILSIIWKIFPEMGMR
jgi:hypothetical protein